MSTRAAGPSFIGFLLSGVLAVAVLSPPEAHTRPGQDFNQTLVPGLFLGAARDGVVYLEVGLSKTHFPGLKTRADWKAAWTIFFDRALKDYPGHAIAAKDLEPSRYKYGWIATRADLAYVSSVVDLRVGDLLDVRTPSGAGKVRVTGYQVVVSDVQPSHLLLAISTPENGSVVPDTDLLVAAPRLPLCKVACTNSAVPPTGQTLERIRKVVWRGAKVKETGRRIEEAGHRIEELVALRGHFTRRDQWQYVVYARFGPDPSPYPEYRSHYWRTVILDSDLSIVAVLSENDYAHAVPTSVGDVNGDGLDEIWASLLGSEGDSFGLFYRRPGNRKQPFDVIETAYFGV